MLPRGDVLVKKDNKILPFNEACPDEAKAIDGILDSSAQVYVYVLSFNDLKIGEHYRKKFKEIFKIPE